jgi:hypothetical protein
MNPLLLEGLSDAVGFVAGFLIAYGLAILIGCNPMAPGYGYPAIIGMVMVGLGGGLGLQLARRWRRARAGQDTHKE